MNTSSSILRTAVGTSMHTKQKAPIGVFDSGLGGLSVWQHLRMTLPHEDFIYVADTANIPYGDKSETWIRERVDNIVQWFIERGCKAVVLACNTATAAAISYLRARHPDVFLVGLEPAIKPALQLTQNKTIAMLATASTVNSEKYAKLLARCITPESDIQVLSIACIGLAERIDAGDTSSEITVALIEHYLQQAKEADVIVLGCTHYPFVIEHIRAYVAENVKIIDSGAPVARYTRDVLSARNGLNSKPTPGTLEWQSSRITASDKLRWSLFSGQNIEQVIKLDLS